jgi:HECT-domain (ubiquitin-transferase)
VLCLFIYCHRDNNLQESELELFFTTDLDTLGKVTQHDLKPDGAQIQVTEENKQEYIG